jgi:hypothetical protein
LAAVASLHLVPAVISKARAYERPWEVHEWRNACAVLKEAHPEPWADVLAVLRRFRLRRNAVLEPGRGKSRISVAIDTVLYSRGWAERGSKTAILVDANRVHSPTHKIDCSKDRVGLRSSGTTRMRSTIATSTTSGCCSSFA